jgi:hypothetical protein
VTWSFSLHDLARQLRSPPRFTFLLPLRQCRTASVSAKTPLWLGRLCRSTREGRCSAYGRTRRPRAEGEARGEAVLAIDRARRASRWALAWVVRDVTRGQVAGRSGFGVGSGPMRVATVRSRCECQASLVALLNESRHVLSAYSVDRSGERDDAPAHTMGAQSDRFDVGWLCAVCGRNVLRSFWADALGWQEVAEAPAGEAVASEAGAGSIGVGAARAAAGAPAVGGAPAKGAGPGVGNVPGASTAKLRRAPRGATGRRSSGSAAGARTWGAQGPGRTGGRSGGGRSERDREPASSASLRGHAGRPVRTRARGAFLGPRRRSAGAMLPGARRRGGARGATARRAAAFTRDEGGPA